MVQPVPCVLTFLTFEFVQQIVPARAIFQAVLRWLLTGTWIKATDSDGLRLTVQTQADGVVSGVAVSLPLLCPITTRH